MNEAAQNLTPPTKPPRAFTPRQQKLLAALVLSPDVKTACQAAGVPGRFGWDGAFSTSLYVDRHEDMVGVLMAQCRPGALRLPPVLLDFIAHRVQAAYRLKLTSKIITVTKWARGTKLPSREVESRSTARGPTTSLQ